MLGVTVFVTAANTIVKDGLFTVLSGTQVAPITVDIINILHVRPLYNYIVLMNNK